MKMRTYTPLLILLLVFTACEKKDGAVTRPVEFTGTTYQTLGTYDNSGRPNYLTNKDVISNELLSFVQTSLPDKDLRTTNPGLLTNPAIGDLTITQSSDVFITFVAQGSVSMRNALGFYTYPTGSSPTSPKDIKTITYVFPHAGVETALTPGDKVKIGRFNSGTSIGFVLLQNAWNYLSHDLNNKSVHFCSNDILNPEVDPALKKHAVLLNYAPENKVLIGFEDLDRTTAICDHDFNDLVIYATVTP
jgi:hypothetical protein